MNFTSPLAGTVSPSSVNAINYTMNTAGLTLLSTYTGTVTITSNDAGSPDTIPFSLLVDNASQLEAPSPITTAVNGANIEFSWPAVSGATGYAVYTSSDPYGTFTHTDDTATNSYSAAYGDKLFYYFTSTDAKSAAPETIFIAKPKAVK